MKELSESKKTWIRVVYEAFKILKEAWWGLSRKEIIEKIPQRLELSEWETERLTKTGYTRWITYLSWFLVDSVKAGFITKKMIKRNSFWILTKEWEEAINLWPLWLFEAANKEYKKREEENHKVNENWEYIEFETWEEAKLEDFNIIEFCKEIEIDRFSSIKFHSLWDPERIKISSIIYECNKNNRVLPNFQRYFDRTKDRIRWLLESIFKDYYVWSFLLWKNRKSEVWVQPILWVKKETIDQTHIILDWQQRITSLYYAIKAPDISLKRQDKVTYFYINFYNFLKDDWWKEIIEYHDRKFSLQDTYNKLLFPMYELENYNIWLDWLEEHMIDQFNWDIDIFKKWAKIKTIITNKLKHIWDGFEIPYVSLPDTIWLYQVSDIFEQINTKGKPLTIFDLLIARLYKYNIELRELRDITVKKYSNIHRYYKEWKIDNMPIYILQAISLLYEKNSSTKKQDVLDIYTKIYENWETSFENDWEDISKYMNIAIERLENFRWYWVKNERTLPFEPMIPVLSALLKLVDERNDKKECYKKIDKWYWASIFTNAYSFSADSQKTLDFRELKRRFDDNEFKPKFMEIIEREIDNLYLIDVQKNRSAKYRWVLSILAMQWAKDFNTWQTLENAKENDKDHIFPKVFQSEDWSHKKINSVFNMTRLSSSTNKSKLDKKPSVYIPKIINEKYEGNEQEFKKLLNTHLIDDKAYDALISDNLQNFMEIREKNIVMKIKELVWLSENNSVESLIVPEKHFSNEMAFIKTIKSCDEYIYRIDKYFSETGFEFLVKAIKNSNIKEIKIILAIDNVSDALRKTFKKFRDELNNNNSINCEMRVITDDKEKKSVHDRFIVSKYTAYNIPSTDTIKRWQLSEITESKNKDQLYKVFNEIRDNWKDIIDDWNYINNFLNNKK